MHLFFQIQNTKLLIFYMDGQDFWPIWILFFMFSFITSSELIIFVLLYHIVAFISSFSLTRSLLVPDAFVSIKSIDWILLWSFHLEAILVNFNLISSVKTLCCLPLYHSVFLILIYCFI